MKIVSTGGLGVFPGSILVGEIFEDRRIATVQRRARGGGVPQILRRYTAAGGRRVGDEEAHLERRSGFTAMNVGWVNPRRRKGEERRKNPPSVGYIKWPVFNQVLRRRKSDERRVMQRRRPADTFMWGGRRAAAADRRAIVRADPLARPIIDPNVSRPDARVGELWSAAEDARVVRDYRAGLKLDQQCRLHGRKEGGINSRLEQLIGESHRHKRGLSQAQRDELLGEVKKLEQAARDLRNRIYEATK
jgi:hypothetical protein